MVLHKQLRVLSRGTPCFIVTQTGECTYNGASDEILAKMTKANSKFRDSFVKEVKIVKVPEVALRIMVKCKEDKLNENQGK